MHSFTKKQIKFAPLLMSVIALLVQRLQLRAGVLGRRTGFAVFHVAHLEIRGEAQRAAITSPAHGD